MSFTQLIFSSLSKIPVLWRDVGRKTDPNLVIDHIIAVGALMDPTTGNLSDHDQWLVKRSRELALMQGFVISAHPQVTAINLTYNKDFLDMKPPLQADMIVICEVFDPKDKAQNPLLQTLVGIAVPPLRQSLRHYVKDAWSDAAAQTGARLITVAQNAVRSNEVGVELFAALAFTHGLTIEAVDRHASKTTATRIQSLISPSVVPQRALLTHRSPA